MGRGGRGRREKIGKRVVINLFSSVLVHENERRFACEECGKKFGESKVIKIPGFLSFYSQNVKCFSQNVKCFSQNVKCLSSLGQ
jgi:hypothetical protein